MQRYKQNHKMRHIFLKKRIIIASCKYFLKENKKSLIIWQKLCIFVN